MNEREGALEGSRRGTGTGVDWGRQRRNFYKERDESKLVQKLSSCSCCCCCRRRHRRRCLCLCSSDCHARAIPTPPSSANPRQVPTALPSAGLFPSASSRVPLSASPYRRKPPVPSCDRPSDRQEPLSRFRIVPTVSLQSINQSINARSRLGRLHQKNRFVIRIPSRSSSRIGVFCSSAPPPGQVSLAASLIVLCWCRREVGKPPTTTTLALSPSVP